MILTLTGSSGAGKTTIARDLLKNFPINVGMVPSYTTREQRETDITGEYEYVDKPTFKWLKETQAFLWTVHPHGNNYGTTKSWAQKALGDDDTIYIMILTPEGVKKLRDFAKGNGYYNKVFSFFILSPSEKVLRERLELRGDYEEDIEKRIKDCIKWDSEALSTREFYFGFVENEKSVEVAADMIEPFSEKNWVNQRVFSKDTKCQTP